MRIYAQKISKYYSANRFNCHCFLAPFWQRLRLIATPCLQWLAKQGILFFRLIITQNSSCKLSLTSPYKLFSAVASACFCMVVPRMKMIRPPKNHKPPPNPYQQTQPARTVTPILQIKTTPLPVRPVMQEPVQPQPVTQLTQD